MKRLLQFTLGSLPAVALIAWFNLNRYGTLIDRTLWDWYRYDGGGLASHKSIPGPFSIHYIPTNLYTLLFLGWGIGEHFPWIGPQGAGQALFMTSPAFILTLRAPLNRLETFVLWITILLVSIPSLTVYASGFMQFGVRYYVQVFPFLLILLSRQPIDQLSKILILVSVFIVSFGTWHVRALGFI